MTKFPFKLRPEGGDINNLITACMDIEKHVLRHSHRTKKAAAGRRKAAR